MARVFIQTLSNRGGVKIPKYVLDIEGNNTLCLVASSLGRANQAGARIAQTGQVTPENRRVYCADICRKSDGYWRGQITFYLVRS